MSDPFNPYMLNLNIFSIYSLKGFVLISVALANDLGVYVNSNLTCKHHIATIITKVHQRASVFFMGLFQDPMILFVKRALLTFVSC